MARDRPVLDSDRSPGVNTDRTTTDGLLNRRSYLRMAGGAAAVSGLLGSGVTGAVSATGDDATSVVIDYDEYDRLDDIYRVWNVRSNRTPDITTQVSRTGNSSCAHYFSGNQMTANTVYPLERNHGGVEELYQQCYVHFNGMRLSQDNTMRFFWIGLRNGTESSGPGWNPPHSGQNGWSVRAGFANRAGANHPDEYTFFVYSYDSRLRNTHVPDIEYGNRIQVPMNEWVKLESYQRLNDPGQANGVLRVWINDQLAYSNTSLQWRSVASQTIEEAGPHGYDLYVDNDGHTIYFDDHVLLIDGTREDWQESEADTEGTAPEDDEPEPALEHTISFDGSDGDRYYFEVRDGPIDVSDDDGGDVYRHDEKRAAGRFTGDDTHVFDYDTFLADIHVEGDVDVTINDGLEPTWERYPSEHSEGRDWFEDVPWHDEQGDDAVSPEDDPHYEDPENAAQWDERFTYRDPEATSEYRIYVDGEIVQSDWGLATYNDTVDVAEEDGYAVVSAVSESDNVDGYFFDGEVVAISSEADPGELWISGEQISIDDYPDSPDGDEPSTTDDEDSSEEDESSAPDDDEDSSNGDESDTADESEPRRITIREYLEWLRQQN